MAFSFPLLVAVVPCEAVFMFILWRIFRNFFIKSAFDNIPGSPSSSWITRNVLKLLDHDAWAYTDDLIQTYGPASKLHSILGLHVYNPRALHAIFVKDQEKHIFTRGNCISHRAIKVLLGPGLLATSGAVHKRQRRMLQPVFSGITKKLRVAIESRVRDGLQKIDMVPWMGRTALELVGQSGLGHSFDPLVADVEDEYTEAIKSFVYSNKTIIEVEFMRVIIPLIDYLGPAWFRHWLVNLVPHKSVQRMKSKELYEAKKALIESGDDTLLHQVAEGKDEHSAENMRAAEEDKLQDEELLAQIPTFIMAGVDTTSNALSRVLHLLAEISEIQEKLRSELMNSRETCVQCGHHPPLVGIRGVDGTLIPEIVVLKGSQIFINLRAINTYKAIRGEDALDWKPERWLNPLPRSVEEAGIPGIDSHVMTFINGSNSCIGFEFSQLEMSKRLRFPLSPTAVSDHLSMFQRRSYTSSSPSFKFELSDTKIHWNNSRDSGKPEMWLNVSLAS
ncbi:cytochrome P450 [Ganoderma leucocontextum]|nr:cytochrome P450 [Ganoderma leucocontextum]